MVRSEAYPGAPDVGQGSRGRVRAGHHARVPQDQPRGPHHPQPRMREGGVRAPP